MQCYIDGTPIEHYEGLFWPQPFEVRLVGPSLLKCVLSLRDQPRFVE